MGNVVAKLTCVTVLKNGSRVRVREGQAFDSGSAVVKENPGLFSGSVKGKVVEAATAEPGEVRKSTRVKKVSSD